MEGEIHESVAISPLIVIPAYKLHKGIVELNSSFRVNNAASSMMDKVLAYNFIISNLKDSSH